VRILVATRLLKPLESTGEQRQILCHGGTAGTGQRSDMARQGDEHVETALANEECRQASLGAFAALAASFAGAGFKAIIYLKLS
jgi:hypothetical protein